MRQIIKKIKETEIGTYKLVIERTMTYVGMVNLIMIGYLYTKETPFGIHPYIWILLILTILPTIMIIDWKFIYPSTLNVSFKHKNKEFKGLRNDIKKIMKKLDIK